MTSDSATDRSVPAAYLAAAPRRVESAEQLRARIPGWGVDLDPADRPSVPREWPPEPHGPYAGGFPEAQPELVPRERSIEHGTLPPVFGTTCPPRGLSGMVRRLAYARYSEGRAAHWLLLIGADRIDATGSTLRSFLSTRPDNPLSETGLRAELSHHGWRSRFGQQRTDAGHHLLDPVIVAGPWLVGAVLAGSAVRRAVRAATRTGRGRTVKTTQNRRRKP